MKTYERIVLILFIVAILLCFLTFCVSDLADFTKAIFNYEVMKEYLNTVSQNDNVVYVDNSDIIYFHDRVINRGDEIVSVLYVTEKSIFFVCNEDGYAKVYQTNHNFEEKTLLLTYKTEAFVIFMKDENKIFYNSTGKDGTGYHIKHINENKISEITEEEFNAYRFANDYYSVKVNESVGGIDGFEITSKSTGKTKYIDENFKQEILKIEEAKKLEEYSCLYYSDYILKDDRIYIACMSGDFMTVYQYNFETEAVTFVDWMNMRDITNTEMIDIYVF